MVYLLFFRYRLTFYFMRRLLTFFLLAIVGTTFSQTNLPILQATKIRENSIVLTWQEIPGAVSYKVAYDELSLVDIFQPDPLLEMPDIQDTSVEVKNLASGLEYYFFVR